MNQQQNNFNVICFDFQNKIIDIFNKQEIPFLMKYYLFKDVWDKIQQQKVKNDYQVYSLKSQKQETLTTAVDLPDEFFENNKTEQNLTE